MTRFSARLSVYAQLSVYALAGLVLLSGCGFQLREQASLPFQRAYVEAAPGSMLANLLRDHLGRLQRLVGQRDQAEVIIRLSGESRGKSILSLSGAGKVREYRLVHAVTVDVLGQEGKESLPPTQLKQIRDYSYSDEQVLAKEAEESVLRKEMDDDILRQILRRLAFVNKP